MRALVWRGGEELRLEQIPEPRPRGSEVLFEVQLAGICGSDLHPYRGHPGPRRPPLVLGHEAIGTVEGRKGRFTVFPLISCGACGACGRGEENLCEHRGLLGLDRQGVFAERLAISEDLLVPVPESLDDRLAILVEPLATAVSALRAVGVRGPENVFVAGCGPLGLLAVYASVSRGARVFAVEPVAERRALAERLGATETFADLSGAPQAFADVAVDAVGIEATWRSAVASVRAGGSVAIIGLGQADGRMPIGDLVRRGITVRGHYAYRRPDFDDALELLKMHPLPADWLTILNLDDGAEAFRRLVHEPASVTKVLLATHVVAATETFQATLGGFEA